MSKKNRNRRRPVTANTTPEITLDELKTSEPDVIVVAEDTATQTCPKCKHENRAQAKFCAECGHNLAVRGKTKKLEDVQSDKPSLVARIYATILGFFKGLLGEFRGASDLVLARVKPIRSFCNAKNVRLMWGVATAVSGFTACIMWSPVWLGIYVGLITLYTFLEPFFQVGAAVAAPFVMAYTRCERLFLYGVRKGREFRAFLDRKAAQRRLNQEAEARKLTAEHEEGSASEERDETPVTA
jgi:hypothetical protein